MVDAASPITIGIGLSYPSWQLASALTSRGRSGVPILSYMLEFKMVAIRYCPVGMFKTAVKPARIRPCAGRIAPPARGAAEPKNPLPALAIPVPTSECKRSQAGCPLRAPTASAPRRRGCATSRSWLASTFGIVHLAPNPMASILRVILPERRMRGRECCE